MTNLSFQGGKMKKIISLLILSLSTQVLAKEPVQFQGRFECTGVDLSTQETFTHTVAIERAGDTYSLQSEHNNDHYIGTGILDTNSQTLAAVFSNVNNDKETGIIIFHAKNNKDLDVKWTYLREHKIANATCHRQN
jgi:hypothetical protein